MSLWIRHIFNALHTADYRLFATFLQAYFLYYLSEYINSDISGGFIGYTTATVTTGNTYRRDPQSALAVYATTATAAI